MENIQKKIDEMMQAKLLSLIQENAVRLKKIGIKYTSMNKSNSLEKMEAVYDSHEKLLKGVFRELPAIEKRIREKFVEPFHEERKIRMISFVNAEVEHIFKKLEDGWRGEYKKLGKEDLFLRRFEESQKMFNMNLEAQADKLLKSLEQTSQTRGYQAGELSEIYGIDKNFVVEMNFMAPLQTISSVFEGMGGNPDAQNHYSFIKKCIREMSKSILEIHGDKAMSVEERKARKRHDAKESILLCDMTRDIQMLAQQLADPVEFRNKSIAEKVWARLEKILHEKKGGENVVPGLRAFYEFVLQHGN